MKLSNKKGENNESKAYKLVEEMKGNLEIMCETIQQFMSMNKLENLP